MAVGCWLMDSLRDSAFLCAFCVKLNCQAVSAKRKAGGIILNYEF